MRNIRTYTLNDEVLSLAVDSEGRILVGGSFTIINAGGGNSNRSYVARLIDSNQSPRRTRFDFDGDGRADIAVFRPSNGVWYVLGSQNGFFTGQFGAFGDKPVAADYDGDGKADFAVFRNGFWYILESNGGFRGLQFGNPTDLPIAADYDGDGKTDIAVYRAGNWYMLKSSNSGFYAELFGNPDDQPIPSAFR